MNSTPPPSLAPLHPIQTDPHNAACAWALCGMWAKCRAEVMGSSRMVGSRVHGGVKETRPWLLFAFFPQLRFLPTGGCVQCATVLTSQQPRHCTDRVCFSAFIKSSPGRKTTSITTSWVLVSLALCIPPLLPENAFVFGLVKSRVYLYPHMQAVCSTLFPLQFIIFLQDFFKVFFVPESQLTHFKIKSKKQKNNFYCTPRIRLIITNNKGQLQLFHPIKRFPCTLCTLFKNIWSLINFVIKKRQRPPS